MMSFDFTKLSTTFEQIDAAKKRIDLGGMGAMSAALGAADRASSTLDRMDAYGIGAGFAGAHGAKIGALPSGVLGTGFGGVTGLGIAEAKLIPLGRGLTTLAGFPKENSLSAAAGLAKPPSWMEPVSGVSRVVEKMAKPGVLDGLGGADKWRGFGVSASLAGVDRDPWDFDAARGLSGLGKPGMLGNFEPGWAGAAFYGAAGLAGAGGLARSPSVFGGLFEPFEGIGEIARKAFGWVDTIRPYLDGWARIAEEAMRVAERTATQPASPEANLVAFAAYDALEAMLAGRHRVAVDFLERRLNLRATPERLEALWIFLKRGFERPVDSPPLWLTLGAEKARAYLATAVYRGAERIKRRRQMEDDIWGTCNGKELVRPGGDRLVYIQDQTTDVFADSSLDPAKLAERGVYDRNLLLDELMATGTAIDKEIVGLIRTGRYDRADIRSIVGSSRLQAFERKIQRWMENGKN